MLRFIQISFFTLPGSCIFFLAFFQRAEENMLSCINPILQTLKYMAMYSVLQARILFLNKIVTRSLKTYSVEKNDKRHIYIFLEFSQKFE